MPRRRLFLASALAVGAIRCGEFERLPYTFDLDWPHLPAGWNHQETPGGAVDVNDHVYVFHRALQVFDPDGGLIEQWTDIGAPWGLALSRDNTLFTADGHNNCILKVGLDSTVKGQISSGGKTLGQVDFSHHTAVDSRDSVYVAKIKNWRVQKFVLGSTSRGSH